MYFYRMSNIIDNNQSSDQSLNQETYKLLDKSTNKIIEISYDNVIKFLYKDKVCIPPNLSKKEKDKLKIKLSENNYWIPLYDIYSDNLYIFKKEEIYDNVFKKYYRFPTVKFIKQIKEIKNKKEQILKLKNKSITELKLLIIKDQIKRYELMLKFLDNFDPNTLLKTYINTLYNVNEFGRLITLCRKPSFTPLLSDIIPYYTKAEIQNMGLNLNLIKKTNELTNEEYRNLCYEVSKHDIDNKNLITHHNYIVKNKAIGLIQYYSINGFNTLNYYLRFMTIYNEHLFKICKSLYNLIVKAPKIDKDYYLYRFITDDGFISHLNIGDIFTEKGFLSTTRNPFYTQDNLVFGWNLLKIKIKINKNVSMLCIESVSNFHSEEEIIFAPNTRLKLLSKNNKQIYYHPDKKIQDSIQNIYEFEIIDTLPFKNDKKEVKENIVFNQILNQNDVTLINEIDFLKLNNENIKNSYTIQDKIHIFMSKYTNMFNQFYTKLGNKKILVNVETYNSSSIYRKYYKLRITNGITFYCIENNHQLFNIEFADDKLYVNYGSKFNTYIQNKNIDDFDLLTLIAKISYYFNIFNVYVYCNYYSCDYLTTNSNELDYELKYLHYGGIINTDFYKYITTGEKRFNDPKLTSNVIQPKFNYYNLDCFNKIKIDKHFFGKNDKVIKKLYDKIYNKYINNNEEVLLKDYYLWLCDNNCYYIKDLIKNIYNLPEFKDDIFFENDYYIFYPMSFLYNNEFINILPVKMNEPGNMIFKRNMYERRNDPRINFGYD